MFTHVVKQKYFVVCTGKLEIFFALKLFHVSKSQYNVSFQALKNFLLLIYSMHAFTMFRIVCILAFLLYTYCTILYTGLYICFILEPSSDSSVGWGVVYEPADANSKTRSSQRIWWVLAISEMKKTFYICFFLLNVECFFVYCCHA